MVFMGLSQYFTGKWHQCQVTGALDRCRQLTLMFGTGSRLSTSTDFSIFVDKPAQ
jgi:hypothetical protein